MVYIKHFSSFFHSVFLHHTTIHTIESQAIEPNFIAQFNTTLENCMGTRTHPHSCPAHNRFSPLPPLLRWYYLKCPHYRGYRGCTAVINANFEIILLSPLPPLLQWNWEPVPHHRGFLPRKSRSNCPSRYLHYPLHNTSINYNTINTLIEWHPNEPHQITPSPTLPIANPRNLRGWTWTLVCCFIRICYNMTASHIERVIQCM